MSTIQDSDQFLVQRGTTSYKQSAKDLMSTIQDTDLMLIQRGTASYKVTCEDVKDQLGGGGSDFTTVDISPLTITPEPSQQIITATTDIAEVDGSVPADVLYVCTSLQVVDYRDVVIVRHGHLPQIFHLRIVFCWPVSGAMFDCFH